MTVFGNESSETDVSRMRLRPGNVNLCKSPEIHSSMMPHETDLLYEIHVDLVNLFEGRKEDDSPVKQ